MVVLPSSIPFLFRQLAPAPFCLFSLSFWGLLAASFCWAIFCPTWWSNPFFFFFFFAEELLCFSTPFWHTSSPLPDQLACINYPLFPVFIRLGFPPLPPILINVLRGIWWRSLLSPSFAIAIACPSHYQALLFCGAALTFFHRFVLVFPPLTPDWSFEACTSSDQASRPLFTRLSFEMCSRRLSDKLSPFSPPRGGLYFRLRKAASIFSSFGPPTS